MVEDDKVNQICNLSREIEPLEVRLKPLEEEKDRIIMSYYARKHPVSLPQKAKNRLESLKQQLAKMKKEKDELYEKRDHLIEQIRTENLPPR